MWYAQIGRIVKKHTRAHAITKHQILFTRFSSSSADRIGRLNFRIDSSYLSKSTFRQKQKKRAKEEENEDDGNTEMATTAHCECVIVYYVKAFIVVERVKPISSKLCYISGERDAILGESFLCFHFFSSSFLRYCYHRLILLSNCRL